MLDKLVVAEFAIAGSGKGRCRVFREIFAFGGGPPMTSLIPFPIQPDSAYGTVVPEIAVKVVEIRRTSHPMTVNALRREGRMAGTAA